MSFSLSFAITSSGECNQIDHFDEGVELSVRLLSAPMEWIPIVYIYPNNFTVSSYPIEIGLLNNLCLRGYNLDMDQLILLEVGAERNFSFTLCATDLYGINSDDIQFRWLQTSRFLTSNETKDVWSLDNIKINFVEIGSNNLILEESFENSFLE